MMESLVKAILINAAYQGAGAVCGPLQVYEGQPLAIDPLIQDVGLQKKGVLVYEEAKIQYNALLRAFHDHSGIWPDPKVPAGSFDLGGLLSQVVALLGKLPREGIVGQIIDLISKVSVEAPRQPGHELHS